MANEPVLLLTGATGFIGGELLARLVRQESRRVIAVVRDPTRVPPTGRTRVELLQGDIRRPHLGLRADDVRRVQRQATEIVHCAADTGFSIPLAQARAANVEGTANVLDLARRCDDLRKFAHVSTVYVAGRRQGCIREEPVPPGGGFLNVYQQSKWEAEALVFRAMAELPLAVYRLSTVIGDASGRVAHFNYTHQLLRLLPRNVLPVVPFDPNATVDLIPTEWSVDALTHLFEHAFEPGGVHHVCAGPGASLTVQALHELAADGFDGVKLPAFVPLARWNAWVQECVRGDDILLKRIVEALDLFLPHFAIPQTFDTARTQPVIERAGLRRPAARETFRRVVRYCRDTDWGRREPANAYSVFTT